MIADLTAVVSGCWMAFERSLFSNFSLFLMALTSYITVKLGKTNLRHSNRGLLCFYWTARHQLPLSWLLRWPLL